MIVYQIFVNGCSAVLDSSFKMYSKNVYKNKPTQEQIDEFIKACADPSYFDYLDIEHEYKVKILELTLND